MGTIVGVYSNAADSRAWIFGDGNGNVRLMPDDCALRLTLFFYFVPIDMRGHLFHVSMVDTARNALSSMASQSDPLTGKYLLQMSDCVRPPRIGNFTNWKRIQKIDND